MSRKYLDDGVELRLTLNSGVGFDHLPGQNDQHYEAGHMCLDTISGKRFINEGANDRNSSLFVNEQYNAWIPRIDLDLLPVMAANGTLPSVSQTLSLAGTHAGNTCSSFCTTSNTAGGITLTTTAAANDQMILIPNTNSAFGSATFIADNQVVFETQLVTGANITAAAIWAGLKLTNTSVTATDNDQTFFRYQDTVNSGKWQIIDSTGGVDNAQDSGVVVAVSTPFLLQVKVGKDLKPRYYINGELVGAGAVLATGTALIPFVGVQTTTTAAKAITVRSERVVLPRTPIA